MKILHLIDSGGLYGAEMIVLELMIEQARAGLRPVLGSLGRSTDGPKAVEREAQAKGLVTIRFASRRGPDIAAGFRIINRAVRERFDVIHTHGYKPDILLGFCPRAVRRIPVLATVHGWTSVTPFSKIAVYEWLDRLFLRRFERVVAVSAASANGRLLRAIPRSRIRTVYNGISESEPCGAAIEADDEVLRFVGEGRPVIGTIGRLSREKGHAVLLRATRRLIDVGFEPRVIILGDGPERPALERYVHKLGLTRRVLMPGYRHDARRILPLFHMFVLPSLSEGMPVTLLEAMSAGIPVVACRTGGIPEMIEHGVSGLLVRRGDDFALADAIASLANDSQRRVALADKARETVARKFSSRIMAQRYEQLYRELLRAS